MGPTLADSTMRTDVTRSLRATSSLHLPHLVDFLAVSALARRALRPRRPRASPLALVSFPPTHPVHGGAKRGPGALTSGSSPGPCAAGQLRSPSLPPPNIAVVGAARWSESPGRKPEQDLPR